MWDAGHGDVGTRVRGHSSRLTLRAGAGGGAGHQDRVGVRPGPCLGALPAPLLLHPPGRPCPTPCPGPRLQLQVRHTPPHGDTRVTCVCAAWHGPTPRAGTPGTTAGQTAPSAAPSPRPSASASTSWCTAMYVQRSGPPRGPYGGHGEWGPPHQRGSLHPQAGKFGIVPTLINTVAAFTSIGVVSCGHSQTLCDNISLGVGGLGEALCAPHMWGREGGDTP